MVNLYMHLGSFLGGPQRPPMAVWTFSSPWQLGLRLKSNIPTTIHHPHSYSHSRWLQCQGQRTVCQPCPEGLVWNCESKSCAAQGNCPDIPKVCWYVCGRTPPVKKVTTLTTIETIVVTTLLATTKVTNTTAPIAVTPYTSTPSKPSISTENTWVDHGLAGTSTSTTSGSYSVHPSYLVSNEICDTKNDVQCKNPTKWFPTRSLFIVTLTCRPEIPGIVFFTVFVLNLVSAWLSCCHWQKIYMISFVIFWYFTTVSFIAILILALFF